MKIFDIGIIEGMTKVAARPPVSDVKAVEKAWKATGLPSSKRRFLGVSGGTVFPTLEQLYDLTRQAVMKPTGKPPPWVRHRGSGR